MKRLLQAFLILACLGAALPASAQYYVYLKNTNGWSSPTVWAWNETNNNVTASTGWPGDKMVKEGDLWKWTAPGQAPTKIIFSDGGNNKTSDLDFVNEATYDCSGNIVTPGSEDPGSGENPGPGTAPTPGGDFKAGKNLITDYYKVNPEGKVGTNKTINVTSGFKTSALSNWTEAELIAQGVARDVCQAFKGTHERPIVDSYALYAAYDKNNLYLGVQYVYTVWDEWGEGFQDGESKPYNMDGDLTIAFDLNPDLACDGTLTDGNSVWKDNKYTTFDNGMDCMWKGSTKPGVGTPGLFFPNPQGKFSYDGAYCKKSNVVYGCADGLLPSITAIYGQKSFGYSPKALEGNTGFVDLKSEVKRLGGNDSAHTFYEYKFPLADLGINENYIKEYGIGVMIVDMYGASAHSTLPYDPSMFDNVNKPYSMDPSSSNEKEDVDVITYGFARIGKLASGQTTEPTTPEDPTPGDESSVEGISTEKAPAAIYTLQGVRVKGDNLPKGLYVIDGKKVLVK